MSIRDQELNKYGLGEKLKYLAPIETNLYQEAYTAITDCVETADKDTSIYGIAGKLTVKKATNGKTYTIKFVSDNITIVTSLSKKNTFDYIIRGDSTFHFSDLGDDYISEIIIARDKIIGSNKKVACTFQNGLLSRIIDLEHPQNPEHVWGVYMHSFGKIDENIFSRLLENSKTNHMINLLNKSTYSKCILRISDAEFMNLQNSMLREVNLHKISSKDIL